MYGTETVTGSKKDEVEKAVAADLDDTARIILSNWGEIRKIFTDTEDAGAALEDFEADEDEMPAGLLHIKRA